MASSGLSIHETAEVPPDAFFGVPSQPEARPSSSPSPISHASHSLAPSTQTPTKLKLKLSAPSQSEPEAPTSEPAAQKPRRVRVPSQRRQQVTQTSRPRNGAAATKKGAKKRVQKKIITVKYLNVVPMPHFEPVPLNGLSPETFWLRLNVREFMLRFDKLVRLPTKHAAAINDPLVAWSGHLLKAAVVALFRVLQNDQIPLYAQAREYLQAVEHTPGESPELWQPVLEFLTEVDPYAEAATAKLEGEVRNLELLRRLMVLCTGTETIRLTVMNDNDQLRHLQQDAAAEVRQLTTQWKATEKKLAHLRSIDEAAWQTKVDAARSTSDLRVLRVRQKLYFQLRKYNLRTAPLGSDTWGNKYWGLQYKSREFPDWGTWILCELSHAPAALEAWHKAVGKDVDRVIRVRSEPRTEASKGKRYPKLKIKPMVADGPRLMYVSGADNIAALSAWILAQAPKHSPNHAKLVPLSHDIAEFASYMTS